MRAIVVGGGIMGLSAAWGLVRRGVDVTLLEQGSLPCPKASSYGEHRLIRQAYGDSEGYTRLVADAYAAWDRLWDDLGASFHRRTGTLAYGTGSSDGWTERSRATLERLGLPLEVLGADQLAARWPHLRFDGVEWGFFQEDGGVLLAGPICAALAGWLADGRAEVRAHTAAASVDLAAGTVVAAGAEGRGGDGGGGAVGDVLEADVVVVAAGPWAPGLVPDVAGGGRVTPSRQVLAFAEPPERWRAAWAASPMVIDVGSAGFYAVPPVDGTRLKIGDHTFSRAGDPDGDRSATDAEARAVWACARTRFTDWDDYRLTDTKACFYAVEPAERFVVERRGRGWVLAGFSGHGFKFGPWVGDAVAAAIVGERDAAEVTRVAGGG